MKTFENLSSEIKTTLDEIVKNVLWFFKGENVDNDLEYDIFQTLIDKGCDYDDDVLFNHMIDYIIEGIKTATYDSKYNHKKGSIYYSMVKYRYYDESDGRPVYDEVEFDMYDCLTFDDGVVRAEYEIDDEPYYE